MLGILQRIKADWRNIANLRNENPTKNRCKIPSRKSTDNYATPLKHPSEQFGSDGCFELILYY